MSLKLFDVFGGLSIDDGGSILEGGVSDLGTRAATNEVPVGSIYMATDGSNEDFVYIKTADTNSASDWHKLATQDYTNNILLNRTWRDPVEVRDHVATTLPTGTGGSPITVDGVSITDGQRVLFSNISAAGGKNVYLYNQAAGTFSEDSKAEENGDVLYVKGGTNAGHTYVFTGTDWVLIDQKTVDEEGFIRSFIGKGVAGSVATSYSSTHLVVNGDSLLTAIGKLDNALGTGDITNTGTGFALTSDMLWNSGTLDITDAFDALNTAIGDRQYTSTNFVTAGQTITASIDALDAAIANAANKRVVSQTNQSVSSFTSVLTGTDGAAADMVEFDVIVRETGTPARVTAAKVFAATDGSTADWSVFGVNRLGGGVTNLDFQVVVASNDLALQIQSSVNVDYSVEVVSALNLG